MSLLLDALKKAADEKRKITDEQSVSGNKAVVETLALEEEEYNEKSVEADDADITLQQQQQQQQQQQHNVINNGAPSVSDEALGLLIYKTNHGYKKNQIIFVALVILLSLMILITGGLYFSQIIKDNISLKKQRYNKSMRMVRTITREEKLPVKINMIKKMVNNVGLKNTVSSPVSMAVRNHALSGFKAHRKNHNARPLFSNTKNIRINKTRNIDQTGTLLEDAWLKYERNDFIEARSLYKKVLTIEKNNRDALLGLGAIALQEKADRKAQKYYLELLQINPDDPDAVAALTSMVQPELLKNSEQKIKELLTKNGSSAPLYFTLGNIYAAQKRWEIAQSAYFNAWVNDKDNSVYTFNLAVSLDQLGKFSEAKKFYKKSLLLAKNTNPGFSKQAVLRRLKKINAAGIK